MMKKVILIVGSINDITGMDPKTISSSPLIPKIFKIEYTVSIYAIIDPKIISIHAGSLILGQSKIARKAVNAPKTSWLEIYIVCPISIETVSAKYEKNSSRNILLLLML